MVKDELLELLRRERLVAIVRGSDRTATVRTALTLAEEGITLIEVSLSGHEALAAITEIAKEIGAGPGTAGAGTGTGRPGTARIGAGTVLTADHARAARDAGAEYVVTPGLGAGVDEALRLGLPVLAGALTPTEVTAAVAAGATAVKLFPASTHGPGYLGALRGPFPDVPFVPVGGIGTAETEAYLAAGALAVGVGSPLCGDAPNGGDLNELRHRAHGFRTATAPSA